MWSLVNIPDIYSKAYHPMIPKTTYIEFPLLLFLRWCGLDFAVSEDIIGKIATSFSNISLKTLSSANRGQTHFLM